MKQQEPTFKTMLYEIFIDKETENIVVILQASYFFRPELDFKLLDIEFSQHLYSKKKFPFCVKVRLFSDLKELAQYSGLGMCHFEENI